jgi:hypothetical protein
MTPTQWIPYRCVHVKIGERDRAGRLWTREGAERAVAKFQPSETISRMWLEDDAVWIEGLMPRMFEEIWRSK